MDTLNKLAADASKAVADTANWAQESLQGKSAEAKAEVNKQTLESENASVGDKLGAGVNYIQNKGEQAGHESKAEVHKQEVKHT